MHAHAVFSTYKRKRGEYIFYLRSNITFLYSN